MDKATFIAWAETMGYTMDKYGHMQRDYQGTKYRFKIQSHSVRYEIQIRHSATDYSPAQNEWVRRNSGYLKDMSITADSKLKFK